MKTTKKMEDDLKRKMEDDLKKKGIRPQAQLKISTLIGCEIIVY
jgi:hypothetical protein